MHFRRRGLAPLYDSGDARNVIIHACQIGSEVTMTNLHKNCNNNSHRKGFVEQLYLPYSVATYCMCSKRLLPAEKSAFF